MTSPVKPEVSQNVNTKPLRRTSRLSKLLVLALILEGLALATVPGVQAIFAKATSYQPERYTELYFTNPNSLTKTYATNSKETVLFTVANHQGVSQTIPYTLYLNGVPVTSGNIRSLADGASVELSQTVPMGAITGRARITISLTNQHQSIQYWTTHE